MQIQADPFGMMENQTFSGLQNDVLYLVQLLILYVQLLRCPHSWDENKDGHNPWDGMIEGESGDSQGED